MEFPWEDIDIPNDKADKVVSEQGRGISVVLVDPDTTSLMHLSSLLELHSYDVTTTKDVSVAMSLIRRQENQFKLVIANIIMSERERVELIGLLEPKDIQLVFLLPENSSDYELEAFPKGVRKLRKPVEIQDLKYIWQPVTKRKRDSPETTMQDCMETMTYIEKEVEVNVDPIVPETGANTRQIDSSADNSYPQSANNVEEEQVVDAGVSNIDVGRNDDNYLLFDNSAVEINNQVAEGAGLGFFSFEDYQFLEAGWTSSPETMMWPEEGMLELENAKRANENEDNGRMKKKAKKTKAKSKTKCKGIVINERTQTPEPTPEPEHVPAEEEGNANINLDNEAPAVVKKHRLVWTKELHSRFLTAIEVLGDKKSTPKLIWEEMDLPQLSPRQIASHLQKYKNQLSKKSGEQNSETESTAEASMYSPITGEPFILGRSSSVPLQQLNPSPVDSNGGDVGTSILNPNLPSPTGPILTAVPALLHRLYPNLRPTNCYNILVDLQNKIQRQQSTNVSPNPSSTQGSSQTVDPNRQNQNRIGQFQNVSQTLNSSRGLSYPVNLHRQNQNWSGQFSNVSQSLSSNQGFSYRNDPLRQNQSQQFLDMYQNLNSTRGYTYPIHTQNQNGQFPSMYQNLNASRGFTYPTDARNQQNQQFSSMYQNLNASRDSTYPIDTHNQQRRHFSSMYQNLNAPQGFTSPINTQTQNQEYPLAQMNNYAQNEYQMPPMNNYTHNQASQMPQMHNYALNQVYQMNAYPGSAATGTGDLTNHYQVPQMNMYPGSAATGGLMNQYQVPEMSIYPGSAATGTGGSLYQNQAFVAPTEQTQMPRMNIYPGSAATGTGGSLYQNQAFVAPIEQTQMPRINIYPGSAATGTGGSLYHNESSVAPAEQTQMPQMNLYPGSAATGTDGLMNQHHLSQMSYYPDLAATGTGGVLNQNQAFVAPAEQTQMPHMNLYPESAATGTGGLMNQAFIPQTEQMQGTDFLSHLPNWNNSIHSSSNICNDVPEVQEAAPTDLAQPGFTEDFNLDENMFDLSDLLNESAENETAEPQPGEAQPGNANEQFYASLKNFLELDD